MTREEVLMNLAIGLVSGFVSGLVSGILVTLFYRWKDERLNWLKKLNDDKQNMSKFINEVFNELEMLSKNISEDRSYLLRLLPRSPRFESFHHTRIIEEHRSFTREAYSLLEEIESYLKNETIEKKEIRNFMRKLRIAQLNVLAINTSAPGLPNHS